MRPRQLGASPRTLPILAAAIALVPLLCGCVGPSLSESQPRHPGRGITWVIHRHLGQGFSLTGNTVETLAVSGRYLIDVLLIPASGEAYAQIGPSLTVRDLATGRPVWMAGPISAFPVVTRHALYVGKRGYDLATGRQFGIPVSVPAGSATDRSGDGVLRIAGSPAGQALVDANPRTGSVQWRATAPKGLRFCGPLAASGSAVIVMSCLMSRSADQPRAVARALDCFDPATGRLRWSHRLPAVWPPADLTVTMNSRAVLVAQRGPDSGWFMAVDAITGAPLPGLQSATAWAHLDSPGPSMALGPGRTAIVATRDDSRRVPRPKRDGIRALRLVNLADGRLLWTRRLASLAGPSASFACASRTLYVLDGSEFTAYSLATGAQAGQKTLPVTLGPGWISGGWLVAGDVLIAQTADGGLAAVRLGFQAP